MCGLVSKVGLMADTTNFSVPALLASVLRLMLQNRPMMHSQKANDDKKRVGHY